VRIYVEDVNLGLERIRKILSAIPSEIPKALYHALKRAGEAAKTKAGQFASAEYTIGAGTFSARTKQSTMVSQTSMTITYRGSVLPLLTFSTQVSDRAVKHALVRYDKGGGPLHHVFTANIGGRFGAYERKTSKRFPVEGKFGPSTAHMMRHEKVVEKMQKTMQETYDQRIEHEIMRILSSF